MIKVLQWGLTGLIIAAVALFTYSQIFLPLFRGTPVFPFFRRRPVIERDIEVVREQVEEQERSRQLEKEQRKLRGNRK